MKMVVEGLDPILISKLTSQQVEQVTCIECCKYFIAPETAVCGHSLCHSCWKGRRNCCVCSAPVDKKALKLNIPLQTLTEHVHTLGEAFEKLFNIKLEEFTFDIPNNMQADDPTKHVKEWLASSENQFSTAVLSSQTSEHEMLPAIELSKSKIQIHTENKKTKSPAKVVRPPQPQDDWDKIEIFPDTEEISAKPKQNVIGPMDIEPFFFDDNEYTSGNPRRSSRKRELKSDSHPQTLEVSSAKNSSHGTDQRSIKNKQTWSNVKKMRKEFSKLNKKNKSKLNVSIEMCKKAQNAPKKVHRQGETFQPVEMEQALINIDDNTPDVLQTNKGSQKNATEVNTVNNSGSDANVSSNNNNMSVDVKQKTQKEESKINISKSQSKESNVSRNEEAKKHPNKAVEKKQDSINKNHNDDHLTPLSSKETKISHMPFIKKGTLHQKSVHNNDSVQITHNEVESNTVTTDADDIEISIKIGNTITNIVIKNKRNDVQMKVNSDREVQTSLGSFGLPNKNDVGCSPIKHVNTVNVQNIELTVKDGNKIAVNKSISTKKNTASADTATTQFEITDSVEKELSNIMECADTASNEKKTNHTNTQSIKASAIAKPSQVKETEIIEDISEIQEEMDYINDVDIFNSGSVKEQNVKLLKDTKNAPSEILMPTIKSKKSQKHADKRDRDINADVELPCSKKQKVDKEQDYNDISTNEISQTHPKEVANDSEPMNYDALMSQVFASIDADIQNKDKNSNEKYTQVLKKRTEDNESHSKHTQPQASQIIQKTQKLQNSSIVKGVINEKYSENVFSMLEKDSESNDISLKNKSQLPAPSSTQQHIDYLLTPGMCNNLAADNDTQMDKDIEILEPDLGTPVVDHDDSDGVVEETPQKNLSFIKPKQTTEGIKTLVNKDKQLSKSESDSQKQPEFDKNSDSQIIKSIINISDTSEDFTKAKDTTVVDIAKKKHTLETPLTINKFVNHIKHNSTPVARKSLNFESENIDDPEQTLCPTTTQEKEFLVKAFEKTPNTPLRRPLTLKNVREKQNREFFVAGSCLTGTETKNLRALCQERGWTYLDKYTKDLTHLVVGVDEENKSQRSVKYMCALAASKWIVTYAWIEKCLQLKTVVDELPYEALDASGEPGPRRSRTALKRVFEGMSFYCMPPFSVLDLDTLKQMLEAAGGRVVEDPQGVKVTPETSTRPALLLAEPEHTQEDRFIYLAMEHSVVPVNYEWALNCLGSYSLGSIHELLLCPPALLPPATANWPAVLLLQIEDDD